ncbi:Electron transport complex subunit RsxE [wastewater metagenome]|uniref:Electron transport complex subunit RsxE n=4 Tax=root TaxID=1 RepID=A0A5B8RCN7_9ZZZZ|nr:electron transport complex subunit RsxE [uncultured organism]
MATPGAQRILADGLWHNNAGLVQLLGLCPLLAVSATVVNALGLGLATTLTLLASNTTVSLLRRQVPAEVRIPVYVLVIATFVTVIGMLMNAYFHALYGILGIFIPLIVTNCAILGRAEAFASRHPAGPAALDGLATGAGFTAVLVVLGAGREVLGRGTLFHNAHLILGDWARGWEIAVLPGYDGFLLAALPPGAFIGLGLLLAGRNAIDARQRRRRHARAGAPAGGEAAA